jgi:hypothetical protein
VVVDGTEGSVARAAVGDRAPSAVGVRTGWLVSRGRTAAQLTLLLIFCFSCWLAQFGANHQQENQNGCSICLCSFHSRAYLHDCFRQLVASKEGTGQITEAVGLTYLEHAA